MEYQQVLLISGHHPGQNPRFFDTDTEYWKDYFIDEVKVNPENVHILQVDDFDPWLHLTSLRNFFRKAGQQHTTVVYKGHGKREGLVSGNGFLSYDAFSSVFPRHSTFALILDTCNSGAAMEAFRQRGYLDRNGLVLAASEPSQRAHFNANSSGLFSDSLRTRLRMHETYFPETLRFSKIKTRYCEIVLPPEEDESFIDEDGIEHIVIKSFGHWRRVIVREPATPDAAEQKTMRAGISLDRFLFTKDKIITPKLLESVP